MICFECRHVSQQSPVWRITDHQMILDTFPHPMQALIRTLQTFFGVTILVSISTLPITPLIFAAELFDQGKAIRAKVDDQLTAATGIANNLFGKTTKRPDSQRDQDKMITP